MQFKNLLDKHIGRLTVFSLLMLTVGAFLAYIVWEGYSSQLTTRKSIRDLFAGEVSRRSMAVGSFFSERVADLENIATGRLTLNVLDNSDSKNSEAENILPIDYELLYSEVEDLIARRKIGRHKVFQRITELDRNGIVVVDTDNEPPPYSESYSLENLTSSSENSLFKTDEIGGVLSIVISVPVIGKNGFLGTVAGWISVPAISTRMSEFFADPVLGSDFLLIGEKILALSKESAMLGTEALEVKDKLQSLHGMKNIQLKNDGKNKWVTVFSTPVAETPFTLVSLVSTKRLLGGINPEHTLYYTLFMLVAIFAGSFYFLKVFYTKGVLRTRMIENQRREYELDQQSKVLEREIRERRLAEDLRARAEVRYRDIFDNASIGIFQITFDGRFVTSNNALAAIYGYRDAGHLMYSVPSVADQLYEHRDDWTFIIDELLRVKRLIGFECKIRKLDGSFTWTSSDMRIVHNEPGSLGYVEGFVFDINKRKRAEQKLADSEKRFRSLFRNSPVSLWEFDGSKMKAVLDQLVFDVGNDLNSYLKCHPEKVSKIISLLEVRDVNETTLNLFSSNSKEELCKSGIVQYINEISIGFYQEFLLKVIEGVRFFKGEVKYPSRSNRMRFFVVQCSIVSGDVGSPFRILASVEDVTELKNFENELQEAKEEAQLANKAKGFFLANMSHEFRTPMNAIIGLAQLMKTESLKDWQRENLRLIESSAHSLLVLVNDILDFSKVDSGYISLQNEPLNLKELLSDVIDIAGVTAEKSGISLTLETELIPEYVVGDKVRLRQIMLNLLSNAVKFSPNGEVHFKIRSEAKQPDVNMETVVFEVIDSGIGLPENKIETLFDPFVQGDGSITERFGGTGLGLAICHKLVALMGGSIEAANNKLGGATFTVVLPFSVYQPKSGSLSLLDSGNDNLVEHDLSGLKVLVAEDSKINCIVLEKILSTKGVKDVSFVKNGQEAVACEASEKFDIIFMDVQMPVMDGVSATKEIRKTNKDIKIIALTANVQDLMVQDCLSSGMDGVVTKPIDVTEFMQTFIRVIYSH